MSKDPVIVNAILSVVREVGLRQLSVMPVVHRLHAIGLPKVPSKSTVEKIMHDRFHLSYRSFNSAKLRLYQTKFNEKRVWIFRLLAKVLSEDFLVVSIDESSFTTS